MPYKDQVYTVLNVTKCIDVLDQVKTEFRYGATSGVRLGIDRYAFRPDRFGETTLFKIPEFNAMDIFVLEGARCVGYRNGVRLESSRPGKATDNAFVESFNGHFRQEYLDQHGFVSLEEARQVIEAWRIEYNTERPHRAHGQRTPAAMIEEMQVTAWS